MEKTVLIVDDSPTLRRIVKFNMKSVQGLANQLEAGDGKEALSVLNDHKVDLILLDLNMPVMDGFEFLEKAKKDFRFKDIPVIVLTTEGEDESRQKALSLGADEYLTKPFQSPELKRILKRIFGDLK